MAGPPDHFISAAIRPLADNAEVQMAARHVLEQAVAAHSGRKGESLETLAARMEGARGRRSRWTLVLYLSAILLSVLAAFSLSSTAIVGGLQINLSIYGFPYFERGPAFQSLLTENLSDDEKFILLGDTNAPTEAERLKALVNRYPDDAAFYADYGRTYLRQHGSIPPDFFETAERIDPGNGWYHATAASRVAREALDIRSTKLTSAGGAKYRPVADSVKLDEAISLLSESARRPFYNNRQMDLWEKRYPLMPEQRDLMSSVIPALYQGTRTSADIWLAGAITTKAFQMAEDNDSHGLRDLISLWRLHAHRLLESSGPTRVEMLISTMFLFEVNALHEAAESLGLKEAEGLKSLAERLDERNQEFERRTAWEDLMSGRGAYLVEAPFPMSAGLTLNPPSIDEEEMRPGRLADHSLFGWIGSTFGWMLLGGLAFISWIYRYRAGLVNRRLSRQSTLLLKPSDWIWIVAMGAILPVGFYQIVQRWTTASAREWGLHSTSGIEAAGQFLVMIMLMSVTPLMIAKWRLNKRLGKIGFAAPSRIGIWLIIAGASVLPLWGFTYSEEGRRESLTYFAAGFSGIWMLICLVIVFRAWLSPNRSLLKYATLSRALVPAYVFGVLLMAAMVPLYQAEERFWFARDSLLKISDQSPGFTRYELDVARAIQRELLEIMTVMD